MSKDNSKILISESSSTCRIWKGLFSNIKAEIIKKDVNWGEEKVIVFGREYTPSRLTSYQGDKGVFYRYSGIRREAETWSPTVEKIKKEVERVTGQKYNFCLLNFYPNGKSKLGWHRDDERDIEDNSMIASVSLGASRDFQVRPWKKGGKSGPIMNILLEPGDLLTMERKFQKEFKHCIPPRVRVRDYRINLTFRLNSN